MKRTLQKATVALMVLGMTLLVPVKMTLAKKAPSRDKVKIVNLDLSVKKMKAEKIGASGGNDRVKIIVKVMAAGSSPTKICSGPFKVKVSKDVGGRWTDLAVGGVANLCIGGVTAAKLQELTFIDNVPSDLGGAQKYRAVVDFDNRVTERNEGNNIGGTRYIP